MKNSSSLIQRAQNFIVSAALVLEIIVAIVLIIAIVIDFTYVPGNLYSLATDKGFELDDFISKSYELVIGIELLKMFCRRDLDSVVEVLLFAISRQIILGHMPTYESLIGVIAIAILFVIRRFLFVEALDANESGKKPVRRSYMKKKINEAISEYKTLSENGDDSAEFDVDKFLDKD